MKNIYNIWRSGYSVSTALGVELIGETEKAYKFKVLNSTKEYTFFLPKKAVKFDTEVEGIINLARWFAADGFTAFLFNTFSTHYKR